MKVHLLDNSRFYVLCFALILSIAIFSWLRLQITADQLFYIRLQQTYGLVCLILWYGALIISPLSYIIGKQRMQPIAYMRRAIGVSAFFYALLHGLIALQSQLGGIEKLQYLPSLFQWSLAGGTVAFVVLGIMAATSFDAVVRRMTYRRWKWLHRLGYAGGILVLLHVWSIGTHLAYSSVQLAAFTALAVLGGLEMFRVVSQANKKYLQLDRPELLALFVSGWAIFSALIFMIPLVVENYHSQHTGHGGSSHSQETE